VAETASSLSTIFSCGEELKLKIYGSFMNVFCERAKRNNGFPQLELFSLWQKNYLVLAKMLFF